MCADNYDIIQKEGICPLFVKLKLNTKQNSGSDTKKQTEQLLPCQFVLECENTQECNERGVGDIDDREKDHGGDQTGANIV